MRLRQVDMRHTFGPYVLDEGARELTLRGTPVPMQPRVFDLLVHLVRNADRVVPKDELMETLWPDVIVTEASLHRLVSLARRTLEQGNLGHVISNSARHGYRFTANRLEASRLESPAESEPPETSLVNRASSSVHSEEDDAPRGIGAPGLGALRQDVSFLFSADGTRIATAACGSGPVILRAAHWLSHVTYDLESPVWRPWVEALSRHHRYVRYDPRGCGMSERDCSDLSLGAWHQDLATVAGTIQEDRFALLGVSQGGALAIDYAVKHPERVSHLVLFNAYAQGRRTRARTDAERLEAETLINFVRIGWGRDNPAFSRFHTHLFIPGGTAEQHRWWSDLERETASPAVAAEILRHMYGIDVLHLCPRVEVPTLVVSCRKDMRVPFEEGIRLAATIPNARFIPLDSANHVILPEEPAWAKFHRELAAFLGDDSSPVAPKERAPVV